MNSNCFERSYQEFFLAVRLALRELRGGVAGFSVLVICIMLGVTAITAVGVLSDALRGGLSEQGRDLLGGDLSFSLLHRAPTATQRAFISQYGETSQVVTLRSMARNPDNNRAVLVEIKAVENNYPLTGELLVAAGGGPVRQLLRGNAALVERLLLQRLGIEAGQSFRLGDADIKVAGIIDREPDRLSGRLNIGPRVLVSRRTLLETGLVRPGSLIRYDIRLKLQGGLQKQSLQDIRAAVRQEFPKAGFRVRDRSDPSPGLRRAIDRFSQFLTLLSLAGLFVGGIGVANGVASHLAGKRQTIATFKSLGASGNIVFLIYLLQILLLAGIGIALGLLAGWALPPLINHFLAGDLPVRLQFGLSAGTLLLAVFYGFVVALVFMLWPLGKARRIPAAELYRVQVSASSHRHPGWMIVAVIVLLVLLLSAMVILTSAIKLVSFYACLAFLVLFFAFRGLAELLKMLFRFLPRPLDSRLAMVRASLAGPTPLLRTVIPSLGIGLSLLVTVSLVQDVLMAELRSGLPSQAPNFFVLDIDKDDLPAFEKLARDTVRGVRINTAPMLRGRLTGLAGRPVEEANPSPDVEWVLRGDRGLTFAEKLPAGSRLTKGKWWPENYKGPPLVSFEQKIAKGLGLKPGDMITVNVLGRDITARIANLRMVKWESLSINFVMVFSPDTLRAAPYKLLATLSLPDHDNVEQEGRLVSALARAFPDITPIALREVVAALDRIMQGILNALRAANMLLLLVGTVALAGALAASHNERVGEAVIFKVLGATRRHILSVHLLEYVVMAVLSGLIALLFGGLAAWLIATYGMKLHFVFSWWVAMQVFVVVMLLVLPPGLAGSWYVLGQSSRRHLLRS